jgi:hypothetical protein
MKRLLITAFLGSIATAGSLSAQTLIGGWDFGKFQFDGSSDQTGDFTATNSYTSDLGSGELFWDGSFNTTGMFSTAFGGGDVFGANGAAQSGNLVTPGFGGDLPDNSFGIRFVPAANGEDIVFSISTSGLSGLVLSFDAITQNGSSDIQFAYSVNGGTDYTNVGTALSIGDSSAIRTIDFSSISAVNNVSQLLIRGTLGNLAGADTLSMDNVQFTAVPEPSAFAAIAGVLVLGTVALRRRRS